MSNTSYEHQVHWTRVKTDMLTGLYEDQIRFWNLELAKIIQKNAQALGTILSEASCLRSALQYKGKTYRPLPMNWMAGVVEPPDYHFPFDMPALEERLLRTIHELDKLKTERYESDRFMSSLQLYGINNVQLVDLFGDNLYKLITEAAKPLNVPQDGIRPPMPYSTFITKTAKILDHMQERVMVNFLMSDLVR